MRLLTFSFLRNCKLKITSYSVTLVRTLSSDAIQPKPTGIDAKFIGDPNLVEISPSWPETEKSELREAVLRDMQVIPDFITEEEETSLMKELEPYLKRMRYEFDHWDNAIEGYRETERTTWQPQNATIFERVKSLAFVPGSGAGEPLPHTHVLDLAAAGHISPHVDAVRFCGEVIAGVCLCSSAVMQLVHVSEPNLSLRALLPRRGLYIMRGVARYEFSHAVAAGADSSWRGERITRSRRVALITRSKPKPQHT